MTEKITVFFKWNLKKRFVQNEKKRNYFFWKYSLVTQNDNLLISEKPICLINSNSLMHHLYNVSPFYEFFKLFKKF